MERARIKWENNFENEKTNTNVIFDEQIRQQKPNHPNYLFSIIIVLITTWLKENNNANKLKNIPKERAKFINNYESFYNNTPIVFTSKSYFEWVYF